jgi:DNA invertase Pin-like site-specific DNA recombinase
MNDPTFRQAFEDAKRYLAGLKVAFIKIENPLELYVFEAEEHIYVDDGISGAEFERRPGLLRLMNAADDARKRRTSTFQVPIVSDLDRLGRRPSLA